MLFCVVVVSADDQKTPHLSKQTRMDLIRTFNAELVYIRSPFPMGKTGLTLKDGNLSPSGEEMQNMLAMWGPAAKPGDQARISEMLVKSDRIHFEINGGPVKKTKVVPAHPGRRRRRHDSSRRPAMPMPIRAAPTWTWSSTATCPS